MYIENDKLIIRSINKGDAKGIMDLRNDIEVYRYEPSHLIELQGSIDEALASIANMDLYKDRQCILGVFKIDNPNSLIGIAEFYDYKLSGDIISIGYRLLSKYWGQGLGPSCVSALLDYIRKNTEVKIVTAHVLPENTKSKRCLQKNGFEYLTRKKEDWGRGELLDTDIYKFDC